MKLQKTHKLVAWFIITLPGIFAVAFFSMALYLYLTPYTACLHSVVQKLHRPDLLTAMQTRYFTRSTYVQLRVLLGVAGSLALVLYALFFRRRIYMHQFVQQLLQTAYNLFHLANQSYHSFKSTSKVLFFVLLLFTFLRSLYYNHHYELQFDEAWNAVFYLKGSWYYSLLAYNNYPLHNLITWCFVHTLGMHAWVLRLPVIMMGVCCTGLIAILTQQITQRSEISLSAALLFACLPVSVFYMLYARGVLFELFFVLLIIGLFITKKQANYSFQHAIGFALLNLFGTLSMVSHPVFILGTSLALFVLAFNKHSNITFRFVGHYSFFSLMFSGLALFPMLFITGKWPIVSNMHSLKTLHALDGFSFLFSCSGFITGYPWLIPASACVSIVVLFVSMSSEKIRLLASLNLGLVTAVYLITFLFGLSLPERSMSFLFVVPLSSLLLLLIWLYQLTRSRWAVIFFTCLLSILFSYKAHVHPFLNWSKTLDQQVKSVAYTLQQQHVHHVYNASRDFDYFIPGIEFYYASAHDSILFSSSSAKSSRYKNSVDSTDDVFVLPAQEYATCLASFKPFITVGEIHFFLRRKINP